MATNIIKIKYFIANTMNGPKLCIAAKRNDQNYIRTLVDCKDGDQADFLKKNLASAYDRVLYKGVPLQ